MKKKYPVKIASAISIVAIIVSVFSMFAPAFDEDAGSVRGCFFDIMWGLQSDAYQVSIVLTAGFCLLLLAFVVACFGLSLTDKGTRLFGIVLLLLAVAGGTICLFSIPLYVGANAEVIGNIENTGVTSLGAGSIVPAVFAYIAALPGLYLLLKKKEA